MSTLPGNTITAAQSLSGALSDGLSVYEIAAVSNQPEPDIIGSAAVNAADGKLVTAELQGDVTETGGLITNAISEFATELNADVSD